MVGLAGKIALVTGGGSGIGKGISKALAQSGVKVAIASRDPAHLEPALTELTALNGAAMAVPMDVRRQDEVRQGVAKVARAWGAIDILVNNAGRSGLNPIDDPDDSLWLDILDTNLTGAYRVTKECLKFMKGRSGGRVINLSSVLGKFGVPACTAYCTTKHGIIGFTKALALELAEQGITVNAICPGWVDTAMARQGMSETAAYQGITVEEFKRQALAAVPLKRYITVDEVAELVVYLASDQAAGITGQSINICGGQTMV